MAAQPAAAQAAAAEPAAAVPVPAPVDPMGVQGPKLTAFELYSATCQGRAIFHVEANPFDEETALAASNLFDDLAGGAPFSQESARAAGLINDEVTLRFFTAIVEADASGLRALSTTSSPAVEVESSKQSPEPPPKRQKLPSVDRQAQIVSDMASLQGELALARAQNDVGAVARADSAMAKLQAALSLTLAPQPPPAAASYESPGSMLAGLGAAADEGLPADLEARAATVAAGFDDGAAAAAVAAAPPVYSHRPFAPSGGPGELLAGVGGVPRRPTLDFGFGGPQVNPMRLRRPDVNFGPRLPPPGGGVRLALVGGGTQPYYRRGAAGVGTDALGVSALSHAGLTHSQAASLSAQAPARAASQGVQSSSFSGPASSTPHPGVQSSSYAAAFGGSRGAAMPARVGAPDNPGDAVTALVHDIPDLVNRAVVSATAASASAASVTKKSADEKTITAARKSETGVNTTFLAEGIFFLRTGGYTTDTLQGNLLGLSSLQQIASSMVQGGAMDLQRALRDQYGVVAHMYAFVQLLSGRRVEPEFVQAATDNDYRYLESLAFTADGKFPSVSPRDAAKAKTGRWTFATVTGGDQRAIGAAVSVHYKLRNKFCAAFYGANHGAYMDEDVCRYEDTLQTYAQYSGVGGASTATTMTTWDVDVHNRVYGVATSQLRQLGAEPALGSSAEEYVQAGRRLFDSRGGPFSTIVCWRAISEEAYDTHVVGRLSEKLNLKVHNAAMAIVNRTSS